jgi:hypothetical protein
VVHLVVDDDLVKIGVPWCRPSRTYRRRVDRVLELRHRARDLRDAQQDAWLARRWPRLVRCYLNAATGSA